ncbi:hypothetical protein Tsubulata_027211, partial [Turnera subulata]
MAPLKVYGGHVSPAVRRVLACLHEKELSFESVPVNFGAGENKKEPYLSLNPFGQIPAFEDGGIKMFESRAISQYVARVYADKGSQLIYTSGKELAQMLVWMEVETHQLDPVASTLIREQIVKPQWRGLPPDAAVVEENEAKLSKVLDVYEARLAQSKYLAGDQFTLADLHNLPCMTYLMDSPSKKLFESRPHNENKWHSASSNCQNYSQSLTLPLSLFLPTESLVMASMKVYGTKFFTNVGRVMAYLYEKELDFESIPVDLKNGEHMKEPYLSLNQPFSKVPSFEEGDLIMFESRAITNYIAKEYADKGTQLLYTSGKELAEMLQWMEVEAQQYYPVAANLLWELLSKPVVLGLPTDTTVVEENEEKLSKILDIYEARLAQSKYLAGDDFTLADLHHLSTISSLMQTQIRKLIDSRPHVSAWVANMTARPAWAKFISSVGRSPRRFHQLRNPSFQQQISLIMASIKLHGSNFFHNVRRVMACLYEKELDFESIPVDLKNREQKKEPYLSLNPFATVPTLEDGDIIIFESRAITNYTAIEYADRGTQLVYTSGEELAEMLEWMEIEAHQYEPVVSRLMRECIVKPALHGLPTDIGVVEENEAKLSKILDVYEARLKQSKYLAGEDFTLADLHHLPTMSYLMETPSRRLIDSRPHVSSWVADITARPAWAK